MPAEDWAGAPCGLLTLSAEAAVLAVNQTFLEWTGRARDDVLGRRLPELLSVGGRIYWETHLGPLLYVEGRFDEVALELVGPAGRVPVLLSAVVSADGAVHAAVSSARERRSYERELLGARTTAEQSERSWRALHAATARLSEAFGVVAVLDALVQIASAWQGGGTATLWVRRDGELRGHGHELPPPEPALARAGEGALLVDGCVWIPVPGQAGLHGLLGLVPAAAPGAEPLDLAALTAIGQQAGVALDRATLFDRSERVAHDLQRSLLASPSPQDPRFAVAAVYRPGTEGLQVGGDWHDTFWVGEDQLAVVVGDVVGRGLGAAIAMGQLRSATRAVSGPGIGPGEVLTALDRFVEQVEDAGCATVAYAQLDLTRGTLRYACAGHPPPLVVRPPGGGELLWEGRSTPLGAFDHGLREEGEAVLRPGDRLLLYTDGLVERRTSSIDERLELLRQTAVRGAAEPLGSWVEGVTDELLQDEVVLDDTCVLALAWGSS